MRLLSIIAAFALALWSLGRGWGTLRAVWAQPSWAAAAVTGLYLIVFLAAFGYLGFWLYAADRAAGKVARTIGIYERVLRRRDRGHA